MLPPENLVSLTMPVRTESYPWDDQIPPIFQMNLPEGYLLQVLQEEFGPIVGANPTTLLSVIGRNMVGRLQVAPPGASLDEPAKPIKVAELLKGDNSEDAFAQLVREHAKSGISGVLPKFLDTDLQKQVGLGPHKKASLLNMYGLPPWKSSPAFEGISDMPKLKSPRKVIGRSELMANRGKSRSK
jgi:serine/threonine-protein kinase HipA